MDQEEEFEQEPSFYAIIPARVRYDNSLPPAVKLLYGEITALCNSKGYCWATNTYFAELYGKDKDTVSAWISKLQKRGYIKVVINQSAGNKRRIYIAETMPPPIPKKSDTYPKKSGDLSEENGIPAGEKSDTYPEKDRHNNTGNSTGIITDDHAAAPAPMGEGDFENSTVPPGDEIPPNPPVAPPPPIPPKVTYGDGKLQKSVRAFIDKNPGKYPTEMYVNFLEKWTLIVDHSSENPAHNGMEKWRTQAQWILQTRLENWLPGWQDEQQKPLNQQSNESATRPSKANTLHGNSQTGNAGKSSKRLGLIPPGSFGSNRQDPGDKN